MGRGFGNYNRIKYELWDARAPLQPSHPTFDLGHLIKVYDAEGAQILMVVLNTMAAKWP